MSNTAIEGRDGMTCRRCGNVIRWADLKAHADLEAVLEAKAIELVQTIKDIAETTDPDHQAQLAYNAFAYLAGEGR